MCARRVRRARGVRDVRDVRHVRDVRVRGAGAGAWWLLLLAALPALVGGGAGEVVVADGAGAGDAPAFLPTRRNLVAPPGGDVTLVCRVARLGDKAVSWVRGRDLQILAHAGRAFAADPRVAAGAAPARGGATHTHTLTLAALRASDAGRYECQLNTDPKLSLTFNLTVAEEAWRSVEVVALGPSAARAPAGGAATLGCAARLQPPAAPPAPAPALAVRWYRDGEPLLPQSGRALGGVALETERAEGRVTSRLTLGALAPRDAGSYVCRVTVNPAEGEGEEEGVGGVPGDLLQGEVTLKLTITEDGELGEMEAMQRDESPAAGGAAPRCPRPPRAPPLLALALALAALRRAAPPHA